MTTYDVKIEIKPTGTVSLSFVTNGSPTTILCCDIDDAMTHLGRRITEVERSACPWPVGTVLVCAPSLVQVTGSGEYPGTFAGKNMFTGQQVNTWVTKHDWKVVL